MKHAATTILLILSTLVLFSCSEQSGSTNPPATTEIATTSKPEPVEPMPVEKFIPTREHVVGQWRLVMTNPSYKNTLTRRYMRHSFFDGGRLVIENEENSNKEESWEFSEGLVVVKSSYKTTNFIEHYKLINRKRHVNHALFS